MYIVGNHEENTIEQLRNVAGRAAQVALMADGHQGYEMPIGGVGAFRNWISPAYVGYDIACGNAAFKTDMMIDDLSGVDLGRIANDIARSISFGMGQTNRDKTLMEHPLFEDDRWSELPSACDVEALKKTAREQLGTVGAGNHYVDVFADEDGSIWVGVHFGSRGFGHKLCTGFISIASGAKWSGTAATSEDNPAALMHMSTWGGKAYWNMMGVAGDYAYAGREWVGREVIKILGAHEVEMIHNHHNFAWKENHYMEDTGEMEDVIVIRKGATPAFPGQKGFVGGSMGDVSVILEGMNYHADVISKMVDYSWEPGTLEVAAENDSTGMIQGMMDDDVEITELQQKMMYSTVHGAGRVMGRMQAKGKKNKHGAWKRDPEVTQDMMDEWVKRVGIELRGGDVDESPHVYKRLPEVLKAQGDTIKVLHTLKPLIVCMAPKSNRR